MAHTSIRFGIGRFTTEEEVDYVMETCVCRRMWPYWNPCPERERDNGKGNQREREKGRQKERAEKRARRESGWERQKVWEPRGGQRE